MSSRRNNGKLSVPPWQNARGFSFTARSASLLRR